MDSKRNSQPQPKELFLGQKDVYLEKLDLIEVQRNSWERFIEHDLKEIVSEFFPVEDYTGKKFSLSFVDIIFGEERYPIDLCVENKLTYDIPVYLRLKVLNKRTGVEKEQDVYFCNLPKMTSKGTFIISGIERAVINQIARAPGVYFTIEIDKSSGAAFYNAEIRPYIGAWIDISINKQGLLEVRINKKRKLSLATMLKLFSTGEVRDPKNIFKNLDPELLEKYIIPTFKKERSKNRDEAVIEFYRKIKPGEPLVIDNAYKAFNALFIDPKRYSLAEVGRYKINKRLGFNQGQRTEKIINYDDLIAITIKLLELSRDKTGFDDIDNLGNRRLRSVGELVGMYGIRAGLIRVERDIKEKMSLVANDVQPTPSQLVNTKPVLVAVNSFFRTSQLSTIIDKTNPLSELDNLRRITVAGQGGLEKDRASFSIRDVSMSQYGRICPIRSPEGVNIGVVTYIALYGRVNKYGFLETPYFKVEKTKDGRSKLTDEIVYLQADDEFDYYITSADVDVDENGYIDSKMIVARHKGEIVEVSSGKIDYVDISPRQAIGIAAAMIPFLQTDDAQRALMSTHMQCQAVPLVCPEAPLVGTGMEKIIPTVLDHTVYAKEDGRIEYVDAEKIIFKGKSGKSEIYKINRFLRTSKNVVFDQRPAVKQGQDIKQGDLLIEGPSSESGNLALGRNLIIAYTSLHGYGFEDGFVLSDRVIKEDLLTSVTMEEFVTNLVDTKLGPEELTRDIPNVKEEVLAALDEYGIIVNGTEVNGGDILVGKVAPKGEKELTAEDRLLRAIFGEKAKDVKDTSLRLPYGKKGIVVHTKIIDSKNDPNELEPSVLKKIVVNVAQLRKVNVGDKLAGRHGNKGVISAILPQHDMPYLEDGTPVDIIMSPTSILNRMNLGQLYEAMFGMVAKKMGIRFSIPVFEKIREKFLVNQLKKIGLPMDGKSILYDGNTGLPFDKPVLVGVGYIMKLIHMVEDKFHARSIGPYSLVTQQPLGGKSQMGGQRFGEMEVWALEAHRVPYLLQEMLTIKSDDVRGRTKAFESIIKNVDIPQSNIPESFRVLVKELNSLGLAIDFVE